MGVLSRQHLPTAFNHVTNPFAHRQVTPKVGSQWIAPTLCLQPCYKSFFLQVGRTYGRFLVDGTYLLPSTMSQILLAIATSIYIEGSTQVAPYTQKEAPRQHHLPRWQAAPSALNYVSNPFGQRQLRIPRRQFFNKGTMTADELSDGG